MAPMFAAEDGRAVNVPAYDLVVSSSPADFEGLLEVAADGAVARVTMTRAGRANALSERQLENLVEAARWVNDQPEIKVVLLDGDGKHFSAGADVTEPTGERSAQARIELGRSMTESIAGLRPVTIARLHGAVRGGGAVLAMACDLRFAIDDTDFSFPEARLGWPLPWGCVPLLVREVGPMRTKDLVLNCRPMSAREMVTCGLALFAGTRDDVDAHIRDTISNLLATASVVLESVKTYVDLCAEAMVPSAIGRNDRWLMMAAHADGEARSSTAAGLKELTSAKRIGPRHLT